MRVNTDITSKNIIDLFALMHGIVRDNKVDDVALLNTKCYKSIRDFNNTTEMMEYSNNTYCDSIIIKKKGYKSYTEQIYLHKFNGFKLNQKSLVIYLNKLRPDGKWERQVIRW